MPLVEKRYAQALLDLSEKNIDSIKQEFEGFIEIYKSNTEFKSFLLDPRIKVDKKQIAIRNIFDSILSKNMLSFVLLLIEKRRIKEIPLIYDQFVYLINEMANILEMDIISAVALDQQQVNSVKEKFRNKYKASAVNATEIVDASLIGGIKVIIGDKVYDGSIKGRIESLTELVSI